ncbi:hypothetical protein AC244_16220 [Ensifer adhaerens]|uniref:Uncharacterized protein n=1 Tax=Ensifer adhaerens TaxID=106592 RepID=A0A0L8BTQ7_ENSAD|nr:YkgJ family cysteine cluster protein [Ensifer adhaerens]KOF17904.1 hypothetical protein AC244_16220 [Ensifer adhaerens]
MNRANRRRQNKEYDRQIDQGINIDHFDEGLMVRLMRKTHEHVEQARRSGRVYGLMNFLHTAMDKSSRKLADVPTQCSKGCWYCCTVWVAAKVPEVIFFAKTISNDQHAGYVARLEETMQAVRGLSFDDRGDMITPCPALSDNLCLNYKNRPNVCRSAASADAEICQRSYVGLSGEDIPTPMAHMMVRGIFSTALEGALMESGLSRASYEFNSAMELVIQDPSIENRWLAGDDVFAGVPLDPDSAGDEQAMRTLHAAAFG